MRQAFLTIIFLFAVLGSTSAQELTVKSMEVAPLDLSASTEQRLDLNKQPCALVKVQLTAAGAEFGGSVIGDVVRKTSEYWVYMSQGSYQLKIRVPNFLPLTLNFRDYGIQRVEPKTTYVLTLLLPQTAPEVRKQKLVINYSPKDAMVLIDSKPYPGSGSIEAELPVGEHSYVIAANGYVTAEGMVKLNGGGQRVLNETLEKETGSATTHLITTQTQNIEQAELPAVAVATTGMDNSHEWVDLGLSVCWATTNVGASKPSDYGDHYAWGETAIKNKYDWKTYTLCKRSFKKIVKYCNQPDYGTVDNKTELETSDDVAYVKWGGKWRIPTYEELKELKEMCQWVWEKRDNHPGYKVTGPNGNSIFLPAAGCRGNISSLIDLGSFGFYWSLSLEMNNPFSAWGMNFNSNDISTYNYYRYIGRSIRPVRPSE